MTHIVATYVGGLDNYPDIKLNVEFYKLTRPEARI